MVPVPNVILLSRDYRFLSADELAPLIGHEMVHIKQIREKGFDKFACQYFGEVVSGNGTKCEPAQGYIVKQNFLECEAYNYQRKIIGFIPAPTFRDAAHAVGDAVKNTAQQTAERIRQQKEQELRLADEKRQEELRQEKLRQEALRQEALKREAQIQERLRQQEESRRAWQRLEDERQADMKRISEEAQRLSEGTAMQNYKKANPNAPTNNTNNSNQEVINAIATIVGGIADAVNQESASANNGQFNENLQNNTTSVVSSFKMTGNWTGSPDCPIVFYQDDGRTVYGDCNNGSYNHIFRGTYSTPNSIALTITRIDPNQCQTSVTGNIQVINGNTVNYSQAGWNGCGVTTPPGSQTWTRR